jgi:hypothetical protein
MEFNKEGEEDEDEDEDTEDEDEISSNFQENIKLELLREPPHTEVDASPDTTNIDFRFTERNLAELIDTIGIFIDSDTSKS